MLFYSLLYIDSTIGIPRGLKKSVFWAGLRGRSSFQEAAWILPLRLRAAHLQVAGGGWWAACPIGGRGSVIGSLLAGRGFETIGGISVRVRCDALERNNPPIPP